MVILDANVILRYLLNDNEEMALEAEKVIKAQNALVTIEVIAEVVYVLKRVYAIDSPSLRRLFGKTLNHVFATNSSSGAVP